MVVKTPVVLIDLDGTLHDSHAFWLEASRRAILAMVKSGLNVRPGLAMERLNEIYSRNPNSSDHYNELLKSFGFDQDPKIISAGIKAFHEAKPGKLKPYPDAVRFLKFLKEKEIPFFLVTDGLPVKQWDKLHHLGLAGFFDSSQVFCTGARITRTEEIPRAKNAAFYQKVLRIIGVSPRDAVVVGDKERADVAPPRALGALTIKVLRGKYAGEETSANHAVKSFREVERIIRRRVE